MCEDPATSSTTHADFSRLFLQHSKQVYNLALAAFRNNRHEAEEIVQETFRCVWQGYQKYFLWQQDHVRKARVMDIAKKRIVDRFRYQRRRRTDSIDDLHEPLSVTHISPAEDPILSAEHHMLMDQLWKVISELLTPTEHRVAFLTWAMDKDDADIANVLGVPSVGTVRSHRSRAIAKIRQQVGTHLVFPGDDAELR